MFGLSLSFDPFHLDKGNGHRLSEHLIDVRNVVKTYTTSAAGTFTALKQINLLVDPGEFVAVVGKSGSGKSTLINMITGIDRPTSGELIVGNTSLNKLNEGKMAVWRGKNIGVIFQFFQLLPTLTVVENVMLPMDFCGMYTMRGRRERAYQLLEQMELADHALKLPSALSGGQQQRVAIARALANDPPILAADEPTGNLDSKTADSVFELFESLVGSGQDHPDGDPRSRPGQASDSHDYLGRWRDRQPSPAPGRRDGPDLDHRRGGCVMLGIRWRKIFRDVSRNKTRSILVILSIAIGVFAVGAIASSQAVMMRELRNNYQSINPSGAWISCDAFDAEFARTIARMPQVGEAEGRAQANVRVQTGPNQWTSLGLYALEDYANVRIDVIHPISGDWPPNKHEILIERSAMGLLKVKIGDVITIETPDGRWHELRVGGTVHDLNQFPSNLSFTGLGYVTLDTISWLGFPRSFSVLHITAAENQGDMQHMRVVAEAVKRKIERGGRWVSSTYVPQPGKHPASDTLQAISLVLGVLGSLVLGLSAFLIINMIGALLMQQVRHIGVMKAVGGRRSQVIALYLGMILIFSTIALAIAVPLSTVVGRGFVEFMANYVNFDVVDWNPPLRVYGLEIAIGLMTPLLAAIYPVLSGTRVTVREALSTFGTGKHTYGKGLLDRALERIRGLPRPLLLSLRNTFRRKGRLALTLATLVLGGAIFIGVLSVQASMLRTLDDALAYWNYDFSISFNKLLRLSQIEGVASELPGVVAIECWNTSGTNRIHEDETQSQGIYMIALPPHTKMLNPVILQGRWLMPEDENAVVLNSDVTKEETDIRVGNEITLMVDGRETTWRVVGIVKAILTGPIAYVNMPYYGGLASTVGRARSVQVITEQHDPVSQLRVAEALEQHFKDAGIRVNARETTGEIRARVEGQFNILVQLLLVMALLLAVVGGLGLMGTMSINVLERTREIGVMRAIGASDGAVSRIVISEGILIGIVSWAIGTAVAYPFSKVFGNAIGYAFLRGPVSYVFTLTGVLIWLAVVVVLAGVASFMPAHSASRLTVRDVLAYE